MSFSEFLVLLRQEVEVHLLMASIYASHVIPTSGKFDLSGDRELYEAPGLLVEALASDDPPDAGQWHFEGPVLYGFRVRTPADVLSFGDIRAHVCELAFAYSPFAFAHSRSVCAAIAWTANAERAL